MVLTEIFFQIFQQAIPHDYIQILLPLGSGLLEPVSLAYNFIKAVPSSTAKF